MRRLIRSATALAPAYTARAAMLSPRLAEQHHLTSSSTDLFRLAPQTTFVMQQLGRYTLKRRFGRAEKLQMASRCVRIAGALSTRPLQDLMHDVTEVGVNVEALQRDKEEETSRDETLTRKVRKQLLLRAIELDPKHGGAYNNLGAILKPHETVKLCNGRTLSVQELYLCALEWDPSNATAYGNLAYTLGANDNITLRDGRTLSRKQLCLRAIEYSPSNAAAYNNLAFIMGPDETVTLHNGRTLSKQELYLYAIELDSSNSAAFYNLAYTLETNENVTLHDGQRLNKKQLYSRAFELSPSLTKAYGKSRPVNPLNPGSRDSYIA